MQTLFQRWRVPLFWAATLFTYVAAILPGDEAPTLGEPDKTDHIVAFITLTLLCRLAYVRVPVWIGAAALSAFGALIEVTQGLPIIGRDADIVDWIVDSLAIAITLFVSAWIERRAPHLYI